ncbi:MAG: AMP-binding protein [Gemmatimonadaceae bacterium]
MHPLRQILSTAHTAGPSRTALIHDGKHWSYAELEALVEQTVLGLQQLGVAAGSAVGIALPSSPELVAAYFAIWELNAVVVEANPSLSANDIREMFCRTGVVATVGGDGLETPGIVDGERSMISSPYATQAACVNLTSGSTGAPKGVLLSSHNLLRNAELFAKYFALRDDDRTCLVLPLYFGMNKIALLAHVRLGATVLLEPGFATPNTALAAMHRERATGLCAVPATCQALLSRGDLARYPQPHLRYLRIGAGRVPTAMMNGLKRAFPSTEIYLTYGLTEIGLVTCLSAAEFALKPESVGRPIDEVGLVIHGEGDAAGEVVLQGDHAALGYYGDPDGTAAVFQEDGLHTGDLGRVDRDGYLYLTGRLKELIKSGGENIYPAEIEAVLLAHEAVADCAVIGIPDRWLGEAVQAYVALRPDVDVSVPDLMRYCVGTLPPIRRPKRIVLIDHIPRNAVGKVRRDELPDWSVVA